MQLPKALIVFLFALILPVTGFAQSFSLSENPDLAASKWNAAWIAPPNVPLTEYGVYHFRKSFELEAVPDKFIVHVSADNRYKLYVNGTKAALGPARGDQLQWRFETVDIAPFLKEGENVIAAVVWNYATLRPVAQHTLHTGFVLQGDTEAEEVVNTNTSWKVYVNKSYAPLDVNTLDLNTYLVVGPAQICDVSKYPRRWETLEYNDTAWKTAVGIVGAKARAVGAGTEWALVPRNIPFLTSEVRKVGTPVRVSGVELPLNKVFDYPLTIPANTEATILLDHEELTIGYPAVGIDGGEGAKVTLTYAESLFGDDGYKKNRDSVGTKIMKGIQDVILADGKPFTYEPLWLRTFRYFEISVLTGDEPLSITDIAYEYSAYPFEEIGSFTSDYEYTEAIWDAGWLTAELCAGETYYDCPYYEQLQYAGDTRIQALLSLYIAGDDRLMRNAIDLYATSLIPDGLVQSRYPSFNLQVIPPYALFWACMVHDYWMHRTDNDFVEKYLYTIQGTLKWYDDRIREDGLLGEMEWWNFVDWTIEWPWDTEASIGGVPKGGNEGGSSIISLQYAYTLQRAAELFAAFGQEHLAEKYVNDADAVVAAVRNHCYDELRGIIADTPDKTVFSQHANIFGILTGVFDETEYDSVMESLLNDDALIQASFYFQFYLMEALRTTGKGDMYIEQLGPWEDMIDKGLTTFAEKPDPTRSDCHAWSSSPNYHFLSIVCGVMPLEPGFKRVLVKPQPGALTRMHGEVTLEQGLVEVDGNLSDGEWTFTVTLPEGRDGEFHWMSESMPLNEGVNEFVVNAK